MNTPTPAITAPAVAETSSADGLPRESNPRTKVRRREEMRRANRERAARFHKSHTSIAVSKKTLGKIEALKAQLAAKQGIKKCSRSDVVAHAIDIICDAHLTNGNPDSVSSVEALHPTPKPFEANSAPVLGVEATQPASDPDPRELPSRPSPELGLGYRLWVDDPLKVVVVFDRPDARRDRLKSAGFTRPKTSYEWSRPCLNGCDLTFELATIRELLRVFSPNHGQQPAHKTMYNPTIT